MKKSVPVGREAYLRQYLDTAKRLGISAADDETVAAAQTEYLHILDVECNRALVRCVRSLCRL